MELPATATPLTRDATAAQLRAALSRHALLGDRNLAELLLAQIWLENANGAAIIQHNIGNLSSSGTSGDFWRPPWFDRAAVEAMPDGAKRTRYLDLNDRMHAGSAPSAFRAFSGFDAGFDAWLDLISSPKMRRILDAASSGNPDAFARAIYDSGYCRDQECRNAGPSYRQLQQQIRSAAYFDDLIEKKKLAEAARSVRSSLLQLQLWQLSRYGHGVGERLSGEP